MMRMLGSVMFVLRPTSGGKPAWVTALSTTLPLLPCRWEGIDCACSVVACGLTPGDPQDVRYIFPPSSTTTFSSSIPSHSLPLPLSPPSLTSLRSTAGDDNRSAWNPIHGRCGSRDVSPSRDQPALQVQALLPLPALLSLPHRIARGSAPHVTDAGV